MREKRESDNIDWEAEKKNKDRKNGCERQSKTYDATVVVEGAEEL